MNRDNGKAEALHIATYSGWYRFEQRDQHWMQTDRALTFWKMTSLQVDPEDARHVYIATEHSGLFVSGNGGADWQRAKPNVPRLTTTSLLALPGTILAGTVPAALYSASNGGSWQELEGVRLGATGGSFPRVPSWERAPAFSPQTMKRPAVFMPQSRSEACSLATMRAGSGVPQLKDWMIPTSTRFSPARRQRDSLSPPAVRALIAARTAGNIGRKVTPPGNRTFGSSVTEDGSGTTLSCHGSRPAKHLAAQGARRRRAIHEQRRRALGRHR